MKLEHLVNQSNIPNKKFIILDDIDLINEQTNKFLEIVLINIVIMFIFIQLH